MTDDRTLRSDFDDETRLRRRLESLERRIDQLVGSIEDVARPVWVDEDLRAAREKYVDGLTTRASRIDERAWQFAPKKGAIRLVLHPGAGKCGSSSLQAFLYRNRDRLAERGIYLPDPELRFEFEPEFRRSLGRSHLRPGIPGWYFNETAPKVIAARLDTALARAAEGGCHTIVISSEFLHRPEHPVHELFTARFDPVDVVFYVRRQDEFLEAAWEQWSHRTGLSVGEAVMESLRENRPGFAEAALGFERRYGNGRVAVRPVSPGVLHSGDVGLDFVATAGLSEEGLTVREGRVNHGINHYLCSYLDRIAYVYEDERRGPAHSNWLKADLHLRARSGIARRRRKMLSAPDRATIMEHFETENRLLHQRYFDDLNFDSIFGVEREPGPSSAVARRLDRLDDAVTLLLEITVQDLKRKRRVSRSLLGKVSRRLYALFGIEDV